MSARRSPGHGSARQGHGAARRGPTEIAFRVAASPRIGFGHLVRAVHLADALGVPARISLRGTVAAATARRLGVEVLPPAHDVVVHADLALLVIDDPSLAAAMPWLRAARRAGVPVASFHDVGIAPLTSDLAIDGSLGARRARGLGADAAACRLGAQYAVLGPAVRQLRHPNGRAAAVRRAVLVGLGGGQQAAMGRSIAGALRAELDRVPGLSRVQVLLSLGMDSSVASGSSALPPGVEVVPPARFREALAQAAVAVVAGGTTLYEACALGTPVVAVPVVPGQAPTVRRFVRAGLAAAARGAAGVGADVVGTAAWGRAAARAAVALLADDARRASLSRRGRSAIDGRGAERVALAMAALRSKPRRGTGDDETVKRR